MLLQTCGGQSAGASIAANPAISVKERKERLPRAQCAATAAAAFFRQTNGSGSMPAERFDMRPSESDRVCNSFNSQWRCAGRSISMSTEITAKSGVPHLSRAVNTPRSGPSAAGSTTWRSKASTPGGFLNSGDVASNVGPGHCIDPSRNCKIGRPRIVRRDLGIPIRRPAPPASTASVTSDICFA